MRESLPRPTRTNRDSNVVTDAISSKSLRDELRERLGHRMAVTAAVMTILTVVLLWPDIASAQGSPWERAASNLEFTFTGPLARSLALVSIVIGGLMFMFGEGGAKRQISGIVFGGGLALFAAQFMTWLF
jgi:type IV secretory pathway VirB2 component (pilin)